MQPIDFSTVLEADYRNEFMGHSVVSDAHIYQGSDGVQLRSQGTANHLRQDMVRLSDSMFLFASDHSPEGERRHRQIVNNSDWLHLQFRLSGGGHERIAGNTVIETPARACTVTRYPEGAVIERTSNQTDRWKVVCLLGSPRGLTHFLDTSASRFPAGAVWMALEGRLELWTTTLPLRAAFVLAVNDILSCSLRGEIRRAYMRAKSLELLSMVVQSLDAGTDGSCRSAVKLSALDFEKISLSRSIMAENLESNLTLAQLARKVGLNRTKLSLGFKEAYGTSVQAYWRDAKLSRAWELLRENRARVTEVALGMGYAEVSSFTRAFSRKFGVLPRDCRSTAS